MFRASLLCYVLNIYQVTNTVFLTAIATQLHNLPPRLSVPTIQVHAKIPHSHRTILRTSAGEWRRQERSPHYTSPNTRRHVKTIMHSQIFLHCLDGRNFIVLLKCCLGNITEITREDK